MRAVRKASSDISQGVTRKAYQAGYNLAHQSDIPTLKNVPTPTGKQRNYDKQSTKKLQADGKWNVDYGETIRGGQLEDYTDGES